MHCIFSHKPPENAQTVLLQATAAIPLVRSLLGKQPWQAYRPGRAYKLNHI
jgi:hypothetical protein